MLLCLHGDCCCSFRNPQAELHSGGVRLFGLLDSLLIDAYINPRNPWADHLARKTTHTVCGLLSTFIVYTQALRRSQQLNPPHISICALCPCMCSRPQKLRWPSFQNSHRPSLASAQLQISCQSVLQMNLLQKLSLLQLTALLERHTPTNKHGFSWWVEENMKCLCKGHREY